MPWPFCRPPRHPPAGEGQPGALPTPLWPSTGSSPRRISPTNRNPQAPTSGRTATFRTQNSTISGSTVSPTRPSIQPPQPPKCLRKSPTSSRYVHCAPCSRPAHPEALPNLSSRKTLCLADNRTVHRDLPPEGRFLYVPTRTTPYARRTTRSPRAISHQSIVNLNRCASELC